MNIAARLQAEAPPGGILISRAVREAVDGRIKAELQALGELSLKNIARPIRAFRVEWKEADWPAGADRAIALYPGRRSRLPDLSSADNPSIAVLAFRNLSGDPAREYFADGMTEDIITTLSRIPNLRGDRPQFHLRLQGPFGRRAAGRQRARGALRPGRQPSHRRKHATYQLRAHRCDKWKTFWAERYDGAMEDVFDLQDRITSSIVATITLRLMSCRDNPRPSEADR